MTDFAKEARDLALCPFCGANAHLHERTAWESLRFQVQCAECYCGTSNRYETPEYAAAAWNKRVPAAGVAEGMAKAAEIARERAASYRRHAGTAASPPRRKMYSEAAAAAEDIAEAILAASPPKES